MRGAGSLAIDAVLGITDIVESLHYTIAGAAQTTEPTEPARTTGITGLVYRNIRNVTAFVGGKIDGSLYQLSKTLGRTESSARREGVIAALNGVLGDHLAAKNNPLAIPMQLRRNGKPLSKQAVAESIQQSNGRLLIMVHGLCMNDLQWNRQGHDHGAALAHDLDATPVYLHYNSGLHISENGRYFADLIESISTQSPQLTEISIVTHSMGGLICRSACHYGKTADHTWLTYLKNVVFLGTPHHGSLLEKGGNWVDIMLRANPYSTPFSRLGKIRSNGITDLRYGNVMDEDWKASEQEFSGDRRVPAPLPEGVNCYSVAAIRGKEPSKLNDDLVGDGLVTLNSALGRHNNHKFTLLFPETHQWIGRNMNHIDLLNHPAVYKTMKTWLKT